MITCKNLARIFARTLSKILQASCLKMGQDLPMKLAASVPKIECFEVLEVKEQRSEKIAKNDY